jgi:hypothetical protein
MVNYLSFVRSQQLFSWSRNFPAFYRAWSFITFFTWAGWFFTILNQIPYRYVTWSHVSLEDTLFEDPKVRGAAGSHIPQVRTPSVLWLSIVGNLNLRNRGRHIGYCLFLVWSESISGSNIETWGAQTHTYTQSIVISEFYSISIIMSSRQKIVFLIKKLIGKGSVRRRRKWWHDVIKTDRSRWSALMAGRQWSWLSIVSIGGISWLYRCGTWQSCSYQHDVIVHLSSRFM